MWSGTNLVGDSTSQVTQVSRATEEHIVEEEESTSELGRGGGRRHVGVFGFQGTTPTDF